MREAAQERPDPPESSRSEAVGRRAEGRPLGVPQHVLGGAQARAMAHGVRVSRCTGHLVDENPGAGPILVQRAVEVREDDDAESLSARILEQEHEAYVEALVKLSHGKPLVEGRRVIFARAAE